MKFDVEYVLYTFILVAMLTSLSSRLALNRLSSCYIKSMWESKECIL